jgi:hypothetical protein
VPGKHHSLKAYIRRVAKTPTAKGNLAREVLRDSVLPWSFKPATWMQYLESRAHTPEQLELGQQLLEDYQAELERLDRDLQHAVARDQAMIRPKQAAELLGISPHQLNRLRVWGQVDARMGKTGWLYHREQLEELTHEEVEAKLRARRAYTT